MTVSVESERHLHLPRIFIPDATNIVSLYTLSHLVRSTEEFHVYFQCESDDEEELVRKICPRAIKEPSGVAKEWNGVSCFEGRNGRKRIEIAG